MSEEQKPEENKPEEQFNAEQFTLANLPKKRKDWDSLRGVDPVKWGELTQANADMMFRQNKELEEKSRALEAKTNNLSVELDSYKQRQQQEVVEQEEQVSDDGKKEYSVYNLPKTSQEWEELMIDDPVRGTDLRTYYNNQTMQSETKFNEAQTNSRKVVQAEHPDMYLAELDDSGQPMKDAQGKAILKVDSLSGEPIFDPNSEKGKLWLNIFNESPSISSMPNAPELLMSTMERRLRSKGEKMVQEASSEREQQIREGQVVQDGVTPPKPNVNVTFKDEEERMRAQKAVDRGVYKNLEEYVEKRDGPDEVFYESNSVPNFGSQ